jgi:hypothetical protein
MMVNLAKVSLARHILGGNLRKVYPLADKHHLFCR